MRGSAWLVLVLASGAIVVAAVPPNHAPNHRVPVRRFRPSPQYNPQTQANYDPPPAITITTPMTRTPAPIELAPSDEAESPQKTANAAVNKLRQLLAVDRTAQSSQVHESKVEAASGHIPLVHALPQLTLLLQLLLHLLHQIVPVPPHLGHYHHSGALLQGAHHGGHLGGHGGHLGGYHGGGLLHHKGPYYGPGLYGVSASNNVLGKGPFPAYKYEDNAKK